MGDAGGGAARGRPSELIKHREVVERASMSLAEIKRNIDKGEWPLPHSVIERTYRWKRSIIEHWLKHGEWPEGAAFRPQRAGQGAASGAGPAASRAS